MVIVVIFLSLLISLARMLNLGTRFQHHRLCSYT